MNVGRELDSFGVGETEHFVVVQNSVHVFDPYSIHWAVAYQPLVVCLLTLRNITIRQLIMSMDHFISFIIKINNLRDSCKIYTSAGVVALLPILSPLE